MSRGATLILGVWLVVAVGADCIASDLPVIVVAQGRLHLLPNLLRPAALQSESMQTLQADWLLPPVIPWGPRQQAKGERPYAPPSAAHWLGTDAARRDVLTRLVHGARVALGVGLGAVFLLVAIGTGLGLLGGYAGGWVDGLISRLAELVLSVPAFFLLLALIGLLETSSAWSLVVILGFVSWPRVQRLVRAETLRLRGSAYVEAARAIGASPWRILCRHLLPQLGGVLIPSVTFGLASVILVEATLSFLGFGLPEGTPSWGGLMRDAVDNLGAWWLVVFPGACVFALMWALQQVGERFGKQSTRGQIGP